MRPSVQASQIPELLAFPLSLDIAGFGYTGLARPLRLIWFIGSSSSASIMFEPEPTGPIHQLRHGGAGGRADTLGFRRLDARSPGDDSEMARNSGAYKFEKRRKELEKKKKKEEKRLARQARKEGDEGTDEGIDEGTDEGIVETEE